MQDRYRYLAEGTSGAEFTKGNPLVAMANTTLAAYFYKTEGGRNL